MQLGSIGQIGRMKKRIRRTACPDHWIERRERMQWINRPNKPHISSVEEAEGGQVKRQSRVDSGSC